MASWVASLAVPGPAGAKALLSLEAFSMTKGIPAAILAVALTSAGSAAINSASAAPSQNGVQKSATSQATDLGARHRTGHHSRHLDRAASEPRYYDRPYYYAPAPFVPFNFGYPLLPPPWW